MEHIDLPGIMRDCMLPLSGNLRDNKWETAFLDDEPCLALLPRLAAICKEWRVIVLGLTRYAALRVAMAHFLARKPAGVSRTDRSSRKREMELIASKCESAYFLLSRSSALQVEICERLRVTLLGELSTVELQELCSKLQSGWQATEIKPVAGEQIEPNNRIWLTPTHRSLS
ncbi:hypothetical protein KC19_VG188300 [Ceratodon purpureus]|uniref:Uncharacterized protein n=1 Tax=Ceratodon purpureus TaxID=3225 RepID=A0A8T0HSP5_CERPU|nr:hypothetical protein KC19_VG188300 [Ceratodon purpureus]